MATTVMGAVQKTIKTMSSEKFTTEPRITKRSIIPWRGKMKLFPMEKFHVPAFISVVHYYINQEDERRERPFATLLLYVEMVYTYNFLKNMGIAVQGRQVDRYDEISEEDKLLADCVGELMNIIAGNCRGELKNVGYPEFIMSIPQNYVYEIPDGVTVPAKIDDRYEFFFPIKHKGFDVTGDGIFLDVMMPLTF